MCLFVQYEDRFELVMLARKKSIGDSSTYLVFDMRGLDMSVDVDNLNSSHPRFIGKIWYVIS
jgi:hypothetical protein